MPARSNSASRYALAAMYPVVKSVVWRSDAIPQVTGLMNGEIWVKNRWWSLFDWVPRKWRHNVQIMEISISLLVYHLDQNFIFSGIAMFDLKFWFHHNSWNIWRKEVKFPKYIDNFWGKILFQCTQWCITKLLNILVVYQPQRHPRSAGTLSLVVPRARNRYGERRFNVSAATLWNKLPYSIQTAPSLNIFKKLLKTHLFTQEDWSQHL
jgi:hypothetical protein